MARQWTAYQSSKAISGVALVVLGMFILYENLEAAVACLNHVLGFDSSDVPGAVPSIILAVSQLIQAHAADHQCSLEAALQHVLISSWPLLLVMIGTLLSRDTFAPIVNTPRTKDAVGEKNFPRVDFAAAHSTRIQSPVRGGSEGLESSAHNPNQ